MPLSPQQERELIQCKEQGREALMTFHNYSVSRYPEKYKIKSVSELESILTSRLNERNFVTILGGAIVNGDVPFSQVERAMEKLADTSGGRLPVYNSAFIASIQDKVGEFSYTDAIGFAAIETAKDVAGGAAYVGDKIISTGKNILDFSDLLIPAALIFLGYSYVTGMGKKLNS